MFTEKVFVYGTLKQGHRNSHILQDSGIVFLSNAYTFDDYVLVGDGNRPYMIPYMVPYMTGGEYSRYKTKVHGELYVAMDKDVIDLLDILEGHPNWYKRTKIVVVDDEDNVHRCWSYLVNDIEIGDYTILKDGVYCE